LRKSHQKDDHAQKYCAGSRRTHSQAARSFCLRQQVAQRGAKGARQDVADPEGQDRIATQAPGDKGDGNQRAIGHGAPGKAKPKGLACQVACCRAQRKGAENGGPVEQFPASCDDFMDGQALFSAVSDEERAGQCRSQERRA